jgi:L-alanine-DL-glutamate epimerase-like enolase superfamily enzyme
MSFLGRRRFLGSTALCTLSLGLPRFVLGAQSSSTNVASKARHSMKITDVEIHEILLPYHDYNSTWLFRYQGIGTQLRTIYIVKTDLGLEGYGEGGGPAQSREQFAKYLDTDPFDWLGDTENLAINMAIYDLMGKYLGLPAWKLLGP